MTLLLALFLQDSALDLKKYIIIQEGTIPIILSAPHGGTLAVPGATVRQGEGVAQFTTVRDVNTDLLAQKLAEKVEKQLGGKPWLVVARFSRKYIDANRPVSGAYESNEAKPVYDAYHSALEKACKQVKSKFGTGLLIDIHGQAVRADAIFRGTQNGKTTTLLTQRFSKQAITGPEGFQGMLEARGYTILPPSKSEEKETRFNGGYIVQHYGSHTGYGIDAIQMEFGGKYSGRSVIEKTTSDLADVVEAYSKKYLHAERNTGK